jgi:hypothetical protein
MARDADIGKDLAAKLILANIPNVGTKVKFTYDPYHESNNLPLDTQIWITSAALNRVRTSRSEWIKTCSLLLYMIVEASPTDDPNIELWLTAFDSVLDTVQTLAVDNGLVPVEITQEDRLDIERLNNDRRLICVCNILYKLI